MRGSFFLRILADDPFRGLAGTEMITGPELAAWLGFDYAVHFDGPAADEVFGLPARVGYANRLESLRQRDVVSMQG